MKRQSDEEKFISELLESNDELCRASLEHGLAAMRRKRTRRAAWRCAAIVAPIILLIAVSLLQYRAQRAQMAQVLTPRRSIHAPQVIEGTSVRILSDAELLEFFKDRPVALVGRAGNQRLIVFDERQN